ncbi:MAG: glycosyltransferase family 4 protein [Anaerolineae bacterium]|nr:glycosyltransferase family 4 protein [Anaerolineae bacterium]
MMKRLLLFNLATDADDPILGFTTAWINALASRMDAIDVVTMRVGRLAVGANVRVYSVGRELGYSEARRFIAFYRILWRLLRANHYDACFAHMQPLFAILGAPLLKLYRVPITLWFAHGAVTRRLRLAERLVDHVVTASAESFRIPSPKTHIIGHGIDTDQFAIPFTRENQERTRFTLVSVGRLNPVKRPDVLIDAVGLLRQREINVHLRFIGDVTNGAYLELLRERVTQAGLDDAIEFAGPLGFEQIAGAYHQADVMVSASQTGSIDKVILEAMACGLPAITSNEAFVPVLKPWEPLLLMPPDDPAALAERVASLMALSSAERDALGRELRALVVRDYGIHQMIDRLMVVLLRA